MSLTIFTLGFIAGGAATVGLVFFGFCIGLEEKA